VAWWYNKDRDNLGELMFDHPVIMVAQYSLRSAFPNEDNCATLY